MPRRCSPTNEVSDDAAGHHVAADHQKDPEHPPGGEMKLRALHQREPPWKDLNYDERYE
jgi:hypothetical protein